MRLDCATPFEVPQNARECPKGQTKIDPVLGTQFAHPMAGNDAVSAQVQ